MCPVADALMRGRHGANEKMRIVLEELRGEERLAMSLACNRSPIDRRLPCARTRIGTGAGTGTAEPIEHDLAPVDR